MPHKYTITDYQSMPEGQTFDRKSYRIEPKALSVVLSAMANADGGLVAVGIEDGGDISGVDRHIAHINSLLCVPRDFCIPALEVTTEYLPCINSDGNPDHILLFRVEQDGRLHATVGDEVFLRVGDKSQKLGFEERMRLLFSKGVRYYEDEPVADATIDDIDLNSVEKYCIKIGYKRGALAYLRSNKGYILKRGNRSYISGAALLIFGKHPQQWFQRARVRVIRYDGTVEKTGAQMNVVKDEIFEGRIIDVTHKTLAFVKTQFQNELIWVKMLCLKPYPIILSFVGQN